MQTKLFFPQNFIDLSEAEFSDLFDLNRPIWEVLEKIPAFLNNKIYIHPSAIVEPFVHIIGPAYIGKNTLLRSGSYLRENVVIGNGCVIGHSSEIKNSIIYSNSCVAHFNYVGDSVLGKNVNVAGGASFANLRLDRKKVSIKYNQEKISTNLDKFGAVVGDGTQIGMHAIINPGTIIGKKCIIYPGSNVNGYYFEGSKIR